MYGCYQYHNKVGNERQDIEYSSRRLSMNVESSTSSNAAKQGMGNAEQSSRQIADFWGYVFQIIFQVKSTSNQKDCVLSYDNECTSFAYY